MEWTSQARQTLHDHVKKSTNLTPTSEIYNDIFTDLTAHVEEELHQKGLRKISSESLQTVLDSIGHDEFHESENQDTTPSAEPPLANQNLVTPLDSKGKEIPHFNYSPKQSKRKFKVFNTFCAWLFTIFLPAVALFTELNLHESRSIFFDPIPTWMHVILIALVPITFLVVSRYREHLNNISHGESINIRKLKTMKALLGFTLPVITYYFILFLPITPVAIIGCIFLLGFLPLAPLFCFIGWFRANSAISNFIDKPHQIISRKWLRYGLIAGLLSLVALETPAYFAQKAITDAISSDEETSQQGIENIRRYGGEDSLLHFSYHGEGRSRGFAGKLGKNPAHWVYNFFSSRSISSKQARTLYYQVTGIPFNSVKPPKGANGNQGILSDWTWDEDHGGDEVAGRTKGLSMHSSRMDMHVDDESRLGYVEWIIEFKNTQSLAKEARMQIALPHNGFVSKLTLWVNGEERPAAFSTVGKVKAAYKKIAVQQRKDPVLVNVSGADRVMLQCFPVPANGGLMKMKVGITFPLSDTDSASGNIHFPYIAERNFGIGEDLKHEIYAQGNLQITAPESAKDSSGNMNTLQYAFANPALKTQYIAWKDLTPSGRSDVWTIDPFHDGDDKYLTRQTSEHISLNQTQKTPIIVVIDSSSSMHKWKPIIAKLIENNTADIDFYLAGSYPEPLVSIKSVDQLETTKFVGGIDNIPALRKALLLAKENKKNPSSILWIHGAQPIRFPSIAGLEQDLERSLTRVPIYNVALEDGANFVLEALKGNPQFKGGTRVVNESDLVHMAQSISQPLPKNQYTWTRSASPPVNGIRVWDQLARKWAYTTTMQHLKEPEFASLPAHYQLVTPLSGAVVLETKQQYIETGLNIPTSTNAAAIPSIPEPSSSLLILIGALMTSMRRNRCQIVVTDFQ